MKKLFYGLVLFVGLFFGINYVDAAANVCSYKQEELGLQFEIDMTDDDPSNYKIISTSCDGISTCYNIYANPSFTISEDVEIAGNKFSSQIMEGVPKEYSIQIDSDSFANNEFENTAICPDLGLNFLGTTGLISLAGDINLKNLSKPEIEESCASILLDFEKLGAGRIKFYEVDGNYYYEIDMYGVTKNASFYPNDSTYITHIKNGVTYSILIGEESKEIFKNIISSGLCPTTNELYVYYDEKWNLYQISAIPLENKGDEQIGEYKLASLISNLKNPMETLNPNILDYNIKISGNEMKLSQVEANNEICDKLVCDTNPKYYAEKALREVATYCNTVYSNFSSLSDPEIQDCLAFRDFYNRLVTEKIIDNYAEGCGFVTDDLRDKLIWVLDLIKIVGPILALGLGTLDFIKVLASGDADKEMKTAFKRFSIRIVAAILLFIIPVILAFLMDIFIGNQNGYNSDNPFCNVVEWE